MLCVVGSAQKSWPYLGAIPSGDIFMGGQLNACFCESPTLAAFPECSPPR